MPVETSSSFKLVCKEIVERLQKGEELSRLKTEIARKYRLERLPTNAELLAATTEEERRNLLPLLQLKPVRSLSGVNVIAVMTPPSPCPHGRCAYCPNIPGVPNSYTGREPSAMRGLQHAYDPYAQVLNRLTQLKTSGHAVSKAELIIQGGTFPATDPEDQAHFLKGCLDALTGLPSQSLEEAKDKAESSQVRTVGITFETRPDCCDVISIDDMLNFGVTKVELGVQTVYDDIYRLIDRGHTTQDVVEATQRLKDAGLKVCYHMMPGLPGANFERDIEAFERVFNDPIFRPDMLKIYPCLVLEGTKIHDWWREGLYRPYSTEEATEFLSLIKTKVPAWVRIMRVQRDIPAQLIVAGVKRSNLRQLIWNYMRDKGLHCHCIRCREVGHRMLVEGVAPRVEDVSTTTTEYEASSGREFFLCVEDQTKDILIGYLRLRLPSTRAHRPEIRDEPTTLVRELHIYGTTVPVADRVEGAWQHRGYGKALLRRAEEISREQGARKILVTSALGVRQYFRKLGYERMGPYMGRRLN